jgi:hypothetical protein
MKPEKLKQHLSDPNVTSLGYQIGITRDPNNTGEAAIRVNLFPSEAEKAGTIPSSITIVSEHGESEQVPVIVRVQDPGYATKEYDT